MTASWEGVAEAWEAVRTELEGRLGECVGSTLFGGDYEISSEDHERLRALGWLAPADVVGSKPSYPAYACDGLLTDAGRLAQLGVGALQILGLAPTDQQYRSAADQ